MRPHDGDWAVLRSLCLHVTRITSSSSRHTALKAGEKNRNSEAQTAHHVLPKSQFPAADDRAGFSTCPSFSPGRKIQFRSGTDLLSPSPPLLPPHPPPPPHSFPPPLCRSSASSGQLAAHPRPHSLSLELSSVPGGRHRSLSGDGTSHTRVCAASAQATDNTPETARCRVRRTTFREGNRLAPTTPALLPSSDRPEIHQGDPRPSPRPGPRELPSGVRASAVGRTPTEPPAVPASCSFPASPAQVTGPHTPAHSHPKGSRTMSEGGRLGSWDAAALARVPHTYQEVQPSCLVLGCCWGPTTRSQGPRTQGSR